MLQNQPQDPLTSSAGQVRVTAEELAAAINALEADRERETRLLEGTVPIGQVVREMGLKATPEELWARIQVQRAQAAARGRGHRAVRAWLAGAGLAWTLLLTALGGGFGQGRGGGTAVAPVTAQAPGADGAAATVSGDGSAMTYDCRDSDLDVSGDGNNVTVTGHCRRLTVGGDGNVVRVTGAVDRVIATGDGNQVSWEAGQAPAPPVVSNKGDGNVLNAP